VTIALLAGTLACALTESDEGEDASPTPVPTIYRPPSDTMLTATSIVQTATAQSQIGFATATPIPTAQPTAAPVGTIPGCTPYSWWPTITVQPGDTLFGIALQVGSTVAELKQANCLSDVDTIIAGQTLYVPNSPIVAPTPVPEPNCAYQWFFTFDDGRQDPLGACPGPVITVAAVGQDFEGGRVLRYNPLPGSSDLRATIYVIYNDGTWESYPDTWQTGDLTYDPSITPPVDRFQPAHSIGKVWREFPSVQQRLGWAYEPQQDFTGRTQEPAVDPSTWTATNRYWYLDHGKWGVVLRLYSINNGPNTWEVAGRY